MRYNLNTHNTSFGAEAMRNLDNVATSINIPVGADNSTTNTPIAKKRN
jgi:hypothetical protein